MISVAEAIQIVEEHTSRLEPEVVSLSNALGRYLAQDIIADSDLPPFNRAQMDGYAVRAAEIQNATPDKPSRLRIAGESAAGRGWRPGPCSGARSARPHAAGPMPASCRPARARRP